jgi:hypothetical protein
VFQIRSSWPQFYGLLRFERLEKSISCVFSAILNIPTPPASTILFTRVFARIRVDSTLR